MVGVLLYPCHMIGCALQGAGRHPKRGNFVLA